MGYSFLQNFTSLFEVFTAIYVSMFIDDILSNIWTPTYKTKISSMIKDMKIPAVSYFVKNVEDNIDDYSNKIVVHMKMKSMYFIVFCLGMLLLSGLEVHSPRLPESGYLMTAMLSFISILITLFGRWTFRNLLTTFLSIVTFVILFCVLYFSPLLEYLAQISLFSEVDGNIALCFCLGILSIPILWQLFLIWVYYGPYKGYMGEKIAKETSIYRKAFVAYKTRNEIAFPKEYVVAANCYTDQETEGDTSLSPLNDILVKRLENLCEPPHVMKIFWSWIMFNLRGRHNPAMDDIMCNGLKYEMDQTSTSVMEPISYGEQDDEKHTNVL